MSTKTNVIDPRSGGVLAVDHEVGIAFPLTPCCEASAKGSGDGIVCRACYAWVPESFGGCYTPAEMPEAFEAVTS